MTGSAETVKAVAGTGAPPAYGVAWDQLNWDDVTAEVTRLQVRIAKATQAPAPMVKQTATPPVDQAANGTAPMKHKHHRHHHHRKAAAPNASQS
ncbi:hypothetical protein [Burkholderia ubonensis]|uniref:hypothetical protein n=1 Tax=Burkholderia ubonensis TaxID=101571 RepID=UPI000AB68F74|nr:hypothetical protein [Burkholderia ubonensis]